MRFIDSHVHLGQYAELGPILRYAKSSETLLLAAGTDKEDSLLTLKFADENVGRVIPFVGVHPSEALRGGSVAWLEEAATKAAGLGEIGLDPSYSETGEGSAQRLLFDAQLDLAKSRSKPIQVHSRGAESQVLDVLGSRSRLEVLLHWFEGEAQSHAAADRGYMVSFGPALLFSKKLQRMASSYPLELILTETDGPVKFAPLGGVGGPWAVPSVVFRLAEIKGISFDEVSEVVSNNCNRYLGLGGKG